MTKERRQYQTYEWYVDKRLLFIVEMLAEKIQMHADEIIHNAVMEYLGLGGDGVITPQPLDTGGIGDKGNGEG